MRVRESFTYPDYSDFTRECVRVGEALEAIGYQLDSENYSQGSQSFLFLKDGFQVSVVIEKEG